MLVGLLGVLVVRLLINYIGNFELSTGEKILKFSQPQPSTFNLQPSTLTLRCSCSFSYTPHPKSKTQKTYLTVLVFGLRLDVGAPGSRGASRAQMGVFRGFCRCTLAYFLNPDFFMFTPFEVRIVCDRPIRANEARSDRPTDTTAGGPT